MSIILGPLIPQVINNFFNNIDIKALKTIYNNEESFSRICRFVIEYLQNLDAVLKRIKFIGGIISAVKSHFCTN